MFEIALATTAGWLGHWLWINAPTTSYFFLIYSILRRKKNIIFHKISLFFMYNISIFLSSSCTLHWIQTTFSIFFRYFHFFSFPCLKKILLNWFLFFFPLFSLFNLCQVNMQHLLEIVFALFIYLFVLSSVK